MGKVRLVYLFMSKSSCPQQPWNPEMECSKDFTNRETGLYSEGTFFMFVQMLRQGIIDDLVVFYESCGGTGWADWGHGVKGYVVPHVRHIDRYLKPGDVIFARGGFRSWHDWLVRKKKEGRWLLTYSANTGRQRWKFWDVIFWDLEKVNHIDRLQRCWYYFKKPTHPQLFKPLFNQKPKYDVCIGSSHIHDKKGQWRVVEALLKYKERTGKQFKAVLPGAARRGVRSSRIYDLVKTRGLDVDVVGMLPRNQMAERVYNASKVAVFMGTHGQGDRGPLEALACGTPLIVGAPRYHGPFVYENPAVTEVPKSIDDSEELISLIGKKVSAWRPEVRRQVYDHFVNSCGLQNVILPEMRTLFSIIRHNPKPCLSAKNQVLAAFGD